MHDSRRSRTFRIGWLVTLVTLTATTAASALPDGFTVGNAVPGVSFATPTAIAFLPDGALLVAEKRGQVHVVRGGSKVSPPLWDGTDEVLEQGERGLMGIAVDPDFAANHRLYFLFTVDPDSDGVDDDDDAYGRLVRYEMSAVTPDALNPSSRTVLLGTTWADGALSGSDTHTVDGLAFGEDGTLLVSIGDGAQFTIMDAGGHDPGLFLAGRGDPYQDVGAFRSQELGSLDGKVLRIDPATGHGLPSNPFWNGDAMSARSRVWAYGLRNPFRFAVRPGTGSANPASGDPGTLYIGDVGWRDWEEVSIAPVGGRNFGWPCIEARTPVDSYQQAEPQDAGCSTLGTASNPALPSEPAIVWHHLDAGLSEIPGATGVAVVGGVFVGSSWPVAWRGAWLFGDYGGDWIKALVTTPGDSIAAVLEFLDEAGGPVAFANDPTNGDVLYVSIYTGEVRRISPPALTASVLDDFERPDGPLGNGWTGYTAGLSVDGGALVQTTPDSWAIRPEPFGPDQQAWMVLETITPGAPEHDLMIKAQGDSWENGHIEVRYDDATHLLLVNTYAPPPGPGWQNRGGPWPLTLATGDRFGAHAFADGWVEVFVNGEPVASTSVGDWSFATLGGRLGLTLVGAGSTRISEFGGGPVHSVVNAAPTVAIVSPAESSLCVSGTPVPLEASATDADDSDAGLAFAWTITAHRATGDETVFTATARDTTFTPGVLAYGEWLDVRAVATDPLGADGDAAVTLLPDPDALVDVAPRHARVALSQARPNPARGEVGLALELDRDAQVAFEVLDVAGRTVWRDAPRPTRAGTTLLRWNGDAAGGLPAAPGLYFARVRVDGASFNRRFARVN